MIPAIFDRRPRVALLRLSGIITPRPGLGGGLSLAAVAPLLERAFALRRLSAVMLVINSPGGSAAQSSLIAGRIRQLAEEKKLPVIACVEDAAASGGYWLACAADEIIADPASILGSIGVIASGFGFQGALERLGVERRVRTAGTEKSFWDPFLPERPEDAERLRHLLGALHEEFTAWVRARRGGRLRLPEAELFSGRFWTGRRAVELGLADRLGDAVGEAKRRFGEKVRILPVGARRRPLLLRLLPSVAEGAMAALEERAAWARIGL
ncbi:MAG TPA: S49 family peptidase [Crenalkalicoccus sp.]|jgi:serine protease SohB|nr:S49 family peptidase [Crenalkalicoccus sp.]